MVTTRNSQEIQTGGRSGVVINEIDDGNADLDGWLDSARSPKVKSNLNATLSSKEEHSVGNNVTSESKVSRKKTLKTPEYQLGMRLRGVSKGDHIGEERDSISIKKYISKLKRKGWSDLSPSDLSRVSTIAQSPRSAGLDKAEDKRSIESDLKSDNVNESEAKSSLDRREKQSLIVRHGTGSTDFNTARSEVDYHADDDDLDPPMLPQDLSSDEEPTKKDKQIVNSQNEDKATDPSSIGDDHIYDDIDEGDEGPDFSMVHDPETPLTIREDRVRKEMEKIREERKNNENKHIFESETTLPNSSNDISDAVKECLTEELVANDALASIAVKIGEFGVWTELLKFKDRMNVPPNGEIIIGEEDQRHGLIVRFAEYMIAKYAAKVGADVDYPEYDNDDESRSAPIRRKKSQKNKNKTVIFSPKGIPIANRDYERVPIGAFVKVSPYENGPRRSRRARFKPLEFWRGEKMQFGTHDEHGYIGKALGDMPVVTGIQKALPTPYKKRKETKKKSNPTKSSKHGPSDTTDNISRQEFNSQKLRRKFKFHDGEEAYLWDDITEDTGDQKVVAYAAGMEGSDLPISKKRKKVEGKITGKAAQAFNISSDENDDYVGYIMGNLLLPPKGIKDSESVGPCAQTFTVCRSQPKALEVAFGDPDQPNGELDAESAQRFLLGPGDMFRVPPGNSYRLENHSEVIGCLLTWTIIRPRSVTTQLS